MNDLTKAIEVGNEMIEFGDMQEEIAKPHPLELGVKLWKLQKGSLALLIKTAEAVRDVEADIKARVFRLIHSGFLRYFSSDRIEDEKETAYRIANELAPFILRKNREIVLQVSLLRQCQERCIAQSKELQQLRKDNEELREFWNDARGEIYRVREEIKALKAKLNALPTENEIINKLNDKQSDGPGNINYCSYLDKQTLAKAIHDRMRGKG